MDKLKIAMWGPRTAEIWGPFSPDVLRADRQIGGAETSLVHISKGLAAQGHNVTVYHVICEPGEYDGVSWKMANDYNARECYDALILWDDSEPCRLAPCAHAVILSARCNTQPHLQPNYRIDWAVMLSEWHQKTLCQQHPNLHLEQSSVIGNGVDLKRYAVKNEDKIEPIPDRIIYCASPDRGLHHLLRMWPKIRERIPDAELHCYYSMGGFERVRWGMNEYTATWWEVKKNLDQPGITNHGAVGKNVLAREQKKASLFVYPSDLFVDGETFANSILECMAAGVPCLISDATCLPEIHGEAAAVLPRPIDDEQWVEGIVKLLADEELRRDHIKKGLKLARKRTWHRTTKAWGKLIEERVGAAR